MRSADHPNYSIVDIEQNTEKSPGDLKKTCFHSSSNERYQKPSSKIIRLNVSCKNKLRHIKTAHVGFVVIEMKQSII